MRIPCICPPDGSRHSEDEVTLREKLDFRAALTIRNSVAVLSAEDDNPSVAEFLAVLTEGYVLFGIESWTVRDAKGPIEPTKNAIREHLLSKPDIAMAVGDACDALYAEAVMLPLLQRASSSSEPSQTDASTSPTHGSAAKRPKPSKRSSITAIPTVATVTTSSSLDGDSNSSQSSTSAA